MRKRVMGIYRVETDRPLDGEKDEAFFRLLERGLLFSLRESRLLTEHQLWAAAEILERRACGGGKGGGGTLE